MYDKRDVLTTIGTQQKAICNMMEMFKGTTPQLLACIVASISAISDGMQYGWSAPVVPILQSPESPVHITSKDVEYLESLYLLGSVAGVPITICLVDTIGRSKSILVSGLTSLLAWILIGFANTVEMIHIARFIAGVAGDMAFIAAPMYVAEIADQKIRGFLASVIYLMMLVGILIIYSLAPFVPFYVPSVVGATILLFQLVGYPLMPESPYYLLSKKRRDAALESLNRLRCTVDNTGELNEIAAAIERQQSERGRPQDLILVKSNRLALTIIVMLNAGQQFTGISVILMNLHSILDAAESIYITSSAAAIIFSAIMLLAATASSFVVDKYGRRILLVISSVLSGICLLAIGSYFTLQDNGVNLSSFSWIPVTAVMVYAAAYKFGLGIVPIVLTAEIFSTKVKAMGMTIGDFAYIVSSLSSIALYQWLTTKFGIHLPFLIFGVCTLVMALYCTFCIPETKGKTLDDIQLKLKGIKLTKKPQQ